MHLHSVEQGGRKVSAGPEIGPHKRTGQLRLSRDAAKATRSTRVRVDWRGHAFPTGLDSATPICTLPY
jgi:hypothetical protein